MSKVRLLNSQFSAEVGEVRPDLCDKSRFAANKNIFSVGRRSVRRTVRAPYNKAEARIVVGNAECRSNLLGSALAIRQTSMEGFVEGRWRGCRTVS